MVSRGTASVCGPTLPHVERIAEMRAPHQGSCASRATSTREGEYQKAAELQTLSRRPDAGQQCSLPPEGRRLPEGTLCPRASSRRLGLVRGGPDQHRGQETDQGGNRVLRQPRQAEAGEGLDDEQDAHHSSNQGLVDRSKHAGVLSEAIVLGPRLGFEAGAGLMHVGEVTVADDLGFAARRLGAELRHQRFQCPPLFAGEVVCRPKVVIEPAHQTDPDVVLVPARNMCAGLGEGAAPLDRAVALDDEVVANVGPALGLVPGTNVLGADLHRGARCRTVEGDELDVLHVHVRASRRWAFSGSLTIPELPEARPRRSAWQ